MAEDHNEALIPVGEAQRGSEGVWVAFNYDGSAFVPFATEIEAYRYAAGLHMTVGFAEYGDEKWMTR